MTPQERDLITALLARLKQQPDLQKDREADALISQGMREQPDAPYLLVQTVLIQDMALQNAQARIADLERQLAEAKAPPQQQPTSFLGSAGRGSVPSAGPWRAAPQAPPAPPSGPAQATVWTQSGAGAAAPPNYAYGAPGMAGPSLMPGAGSGFLRQAATTAAGIAGGALLFQGIQSLFGPHYGGGFLGGTPMQPGISETVINNYYDTGAPDQGGADAGQQSADLGPDPNQDLAQDQGGVSDADYASDQDFGSDPGFDDDSSNFDV